MAQLKRIEVSLDFEQPIQEITSIISLIIGAHPDRQLEILQAVDQHIGDAMALLDKSKQHVEDKTFEESAK
ncbi:hypothetical protein [Paenibacillus lutimineralis]|uniref:Uncharacterized protein n=1 Tax=Paenibacillus lutimineralis TaxID=2707005 RepID=A0A3Q9IG81_9BACL|nr:hypothetical protein [Paenibacillus lutimineralis]AZS17380.1 hypothetical protein EI981_25140 [Paenibacillus lutimineralis]